MDKNKKKKMVGIGVIAAIGLLAFAILLASAASDVTGKINYQGRLTDSAGNPLSGPYSVTFKLYETSTGGTALTSRTHPVEVTNGLFNTNIDFGTTYFDGRALWFGITVGSDSEMTPRQQLRPVPYALSLKPGARIIGSANTALHAESTHPSGRGIRGYATATSGTNYGVVGASASPDGYGGCFYDNKGGIGVYGEGNYGGYFTTNQLGPQTNPNAGVYVLTAHAFSEGVQAHTTGGHSAGVSADTTGSHSAGVRADTTGFGSLGVCVDTTGDHSHGVSAHTTGDNSDGVYGWTTGDNSDGVSADTTGGRSVGVRAHTTGGRSVGVRADTTGISSHGVSAHTTGDHSDGVYGWTQGCYSKGVSALAEGDSSHGVWAYSSKAEAIYAITGRADHKYGVYTPDKICAMSYDTTSGDVAEYFAVDEDVEAGTVMVIGGNGKLRCSTEAYDTTVAGIVSTAPGMSLGINEEGNEGEKLIAVAGRVPCKVNASYAPIKPGDLLTTSDTSGYAMKATKPQIGTILGKALEPMDSGTGVIEVLITLQ